MFNWQLSNVQPAGEKESHERADWKEGEGAGEGAGEPLRQQTSWMRGVKGREGDSMGREGGRYLCTFVEATNIHLNLRAGTQLCRG